MMLEEINRKSVLKHLLWSHHTETKYIKNFIQVNIFLFMIKYFENTIQTDHRIMEKAKHPLEIVAD